MYISWTQIYLSLWHISFSSSLYMTLFKLCHLKVHSFGFCEAFSFQAGKGRISSGRVAKAVSGEVQGVTASVQNEGTKAEQRLADSMLGKTPRKWQSCLFVWTRRVNWTVG